MAMVITIYDIETYVDHHNTYIMCRKNSINILSGAKLGPCTYERDGIKIPVCSQQSHDLSQNI